MLVQVAKSIKDIEKSIIERNSVVQRAGDGAADLKKRVEDLTKNLEEYEKVYQGVLAGKNSGDEEKCLKDQLCDAKAVVGSSETELKDRQVEFDVVQKLRDEVRILKGQLSNVHFQYRDPINNFDRSKVKGVVAELIKVRDSSTMTALEVYFEVAAGGKLYNVVMNIKLTGKQLLKSGDLRRRVTIIPLNKIQSHTVPPRAQQAAIRLVGEGNAELALSLVGY
ncbi:hypothetical protein AQUCO_00500538v1 [Aquilegia coerulea]|uniref:SMC hinge domain-containing protein n=1 Tax=Aquilegia coerulea TaxID=218851 RepID=A0A2G5ESD6_AQUCA|nr:hypothetical protein AQUCO_00500538v1 [Aquilegia coerulea]